MNELVTKLNRQGMITAEDSGQIQTLIAQGLSVDEALVKGSGLAEEEILQFLSQELHVPFVDLEQRQPSREFLSNFPARILMTHGLVPIEEKDGEVLVASSKIFDSSGLDELRLVCGREVRGVLASSTEINRCLKNLLGVGADTLQSLVSESIDAGVEVVDQDGREDVDLSEAAEDASIVKFVNQILAEAIDRRATDVHFEPFESSLRVRYRVDGVLQEANIPQEVRQFQPAIVSRLKILSHLDIAEKRLPQDGRIKLKVAGREVDVRVSVIPMLHGEAVVLRLLDRGATLLGMEHLGMDPRDRRIIERVLGLPHGIVLVTGPTGSGKTTTLYAGLSKINDVERKIITIEDPIEYHLHGINQIQVSNKAGLTFARGLRSILRHDPDVILIGEIRDAETAEIAVQASLTGHLVFSTLHTNDAPGALARLVEMGVEPYLVASSLELVLAQRLVRLICQACRTPCEAPDLQGLPEELRAELPAQLFVGQGCRQCRGTGYRGRTGIFELMPVSQSVRAMIMDRTSGMEIRKEAVRQGMRSLRQDGLRLVRDGRTTLEEVLRATKDENFGSNGHKTAADSDAEAIPGKAEQIPGGGIADSEAGPDA